MGTNIHYYLIIKDGKVGLLDSRRNILFPCIYDDIIMAKRNSATVIENGTEKMVYYPSKKDLDDELFFSTPIRESHSYSRYSGSYAQDVMGYSDEDIDTIFEGDSSAYWNID